VTTVADTQDGTPVVPPNRTGAVAAAVTAVRETFVGTSQREERASAMGDSLFQKNVEKWVFPYSKYYSGSTNELKSDQRSDHFTSYLQGYCGNDSTKAVDAKQRWDKRCHLVPGILSKKRAKVITAMKKSYIGT